MESSDTGVQPVVVGKGFQDIGKTNPAVQSFGIQPGVQVHLDESKPRRSALIVKVNARKLPSKPPMKWAKFSRFTFCLKGDSTGLAERDQTGTPKFLLRAIGPVNDEQANIQLGCIPADVSPLYANSLNVDDVLERYHNHLPGWGDFRADRCFFYLGFQYVPSGDASTVIPNEPKIDIWSGLRDRYVAARKICRSDKPVYCHIFVKRANAKSCVEQLNQTLSTFYQHSLLPRPYGENKRFSAWYHIDEKANTRRE